MGQKTPVWEGWYEDRTTAGLVGPKRREEVSVAGMEPTTKRETGLEVSSEGHRDRPG